MIKRINLNKRGFFQNLSALAIGLVIFAVILVVGTVVIGNLSSANAGCPTGYNYTETGANAGLCQNSSNSSLTATAQVAARTGYYLGGQLGSQGLAGWAPAIIAIAIGVLVIGAIIGIGGKGRY